MSSLSAAPTSSRPFFPTKEDIQRKRVELLHLKHTVIPDRRKRKKGRHVKHETSRLIWIDTVGLPNLLRGKLPSAEDEKALALPHPNATDEDGKQLLTEPDRRWMDGKSLPTSTRPHSSLIVSCAQFGPTRFTDTRIRRWSSRRRSSSPSFRLLLRNRALHTEMQGMCQPAFAPPRTCVVTNKLGKQQPAARCSVVLPVQKRGGRIQWSGAF